MEVDPNCVFSDQPMDKGQCSPPHERELFGRLWELAPSCKMHEGTERPVLEQRTRSALNSSGQNVSKDGT